ncbi:MAG: YhbD family protein [Candidatus Bipolaricaulota bacterium]|nr:YhbD family protein [Candidatus Bipolaricaulota bacterium]MCX7844211.1 YhbD family protein [Candidatus Bipolaricaulota bacterium]MDW8152028.1 DUF4004 family protein [Candidatus Bipolaricaulota bacterium]
MEPQEELIPKKEVLRLTGISYGQLYRWKRLGLIPEAWFIRRSTFTGQETFFPKEKILKRIQDILRLKDEHPLEELVRLLSPEVVPAEVAYPDPLALSPIGPEGEALLWKSGGHSFTELVALACGAEAIRRGAHPAEARLLVRVVCQAEEALRAPTGLFALLGEKNVEREGFLFKAPLALVGREPLILDPECRVKVRLDLERVVEGVKLALGGEGRG